MSDNSAMVRQIQIDIIIGNTNPVIKWFNNIWRQIHKVQTNVYHDGGNEFIYYIIDPITDQKNVIFYLGSQSSVLNNCYLVANYKYFWRDLMNLLNDIYQDSYLDSFVINNVVKLLLLQANENELAEYNSGAYHIKSKADKTIKKAINKIK